ncbi:MAG: helix-turn-helix domain-containing protein [Bacteroidales bacterium]
MVKEDTGYSAMAEIDGDFIGTQAETVEELKMMAIEATNLNFEGRKIEYHADDITFEFDLESFFAFYRVLNVKALSERIGMNQSLLSQYIRGIKKPSPAQMQRIINGVRQIGRELSEASFLL